MSRKATKIFALFSVFFLNSILINAQSIYELPSGTKIRVQMDNEISSKVSNVVRYEGEHLVLYHNDRQKYRETADHSRGGGHPILQ